MSEHLEQLLDEFAVRYRRGESPNLREYLVRAGDEADSFARLVDALLQSVPAPAPSEESLTFAREWVEGESPLVSLRTRRRVKRAEVVDALVAALGLDASRREKVRLRYHELETGQLEPARVDRRVWDALAVALHARVDELVAWTRPARPLAPEVAFFRLAGHDAPPEPFLPDDRGEPDEVDRLFGLA